MKNKMFYPDLALALLWVFSLVAHAGMQSSNYKIPTSVFSSGGTPIGSTNYKTDSTLGQSSPLMDPSDPPLSSNYNLEPGFWYTMEISNGSQANDELIVDFDGDHKQDVAIYRPGTGGWFIKPSSGGSYYVVGLGGVANDIPVNPAAVIFLKYM